MKKINEDAKGHDLKAKFSWWSPIFGEDDIKLVRDTLGEAIQPFLAEFRDQRYNEEISDQFHGNGSDQDDEEDSNQHIEIGGDQADNEEGINQVDEEEMRQNDDIEEEGSERNNEKRDDNQADDQDDLTQLLKQFATSRAFNPNSQPHGSFYFQYDINDLCDYYRIHFDSELQFKILGTFSYKKEVMHAVLVCSQENGAGMFRAYPPVLTPEEDVNNEEVVTRDTNGNWVWKPEATATEIERLPDQDVYPMYRRWEHVAFAFHIPGEWRNEAAFMSVPDLRQHLRVLEKY